MVSLLYGVRHQNTRRYDMRIVIMLTLATSVSGLFIGIDFVGVLGRRGFEVRLNIV